MQNISRRVRNVCGGIACVGALIWGNAAWALRGPVIESAATPKAKHFSFEFGHRLQYTPQGIRQQVQAATFTMAPAEGQQLDLSMPWRVDHATDQRFAVGDFSLLYKAGAVSQWADGRGVVGMYERTTFPTAQASRVSGDNYQIELGTILTQRGAHSMFSINTASLIQTSGDELVKYGASYEYATKSVGVYTEIVGLTDLRDNEKNEVVTSATGIEVLVGKHLSLDAGGEVGITGDAPDWGVFGGATVKF